VAAPRAFPTSENNGLLDPTPAVKLRAMQPTDLHNPYAPPLADVAPVYIPAAGAPYRTVDLSEALRRLHEHVADPRNLEADRVAGGARIRPVGWVLLGIGVVCGVAAAAWGSEWDGVAGIAGSILGAVFFLLGILLVAVDLSLAARNKPASPDKTLRSYLKAIALARFGYVWTCLSPTAREQSVASPDLHPVATVPGLLFPLRGEADIKAYMQSFARTSGSVMRIMAVKKPIVASVEGDVAHVNVELRFQSWPRWVSIVAFVGFIILRPLIIVGAIAYFVTRKRRTVHVTKTMLRAQNGVWYVHDGDVLEGATAT
jgi:hypothetical protein